MTALVTNVQPFSVHDGPGIRTTVFFKGCNLRCFWCHNPETIRPVKELMFYKSRCIGCGACLALCDSLPDGTPSARFYNRQSRKDEIATACYAEAITAAAKSYDVHSLFERIMADKHYYDASGGGVTFSGGEPILQADFLMTLLPMCREKGIHTAAETALNLPFDVIERLCGYIDLFIIDIKHMDSRKHRRATGADNTLILENIRRLTSQRGGSGILIRVPVIPGFNDTVFDMSAVAEFLSSLGHTLPVELMPFHKLCTGKYEALGRHFHASALVPPDKTQIEELYTPFALPLKIGES